MAIEKKTFETPAVRVVDIETVAMGGDLFVFRSVTSHCNIDENGNRHVASTEVENGVVDAENRELLEANLPYKVFQPYDAPQEVGVMCPVLVTAGGQEMLRKEGSIFAPWVRDKLEKAGALVVPEKGRGFVTGAANGIDYEGILFYSSYDNSIIDVRGRPFPVAMSFDYLDAGFTNEEYDLDAVADKLAENPEIEFITKDRWEKPAPITKIPSYNASKESNLQVQFIWRPSEESWNEVLDKLGFDPANPRHLKVRHHTITRELDFFDTEKFSLVSPGLRCT